MILRRLRSRIVKLRQDNRELVLCPPRWRADLARKIIIREDAAYVEVPCVVPYNLRSESSMQAGESKSFMKAIQVKQPGGPEAMELVDLPVPQPKGNEAVVKLSASGVNFIDVYNREGRYKVPLPFVLGQEGAGVVSAVGAEVKPLKPSDRVAWTSILGSYAEYAAVPESLLVELPESVSFEQGAAIILQGMTAHYLACSTFPLRAGQSCLIHAAAGAVSEAAGD